MTLVPAQMSLGLDEIAAEIHRVWDETKAHQVAAWEGYFATGGLLAEARSRFASDKLYGQWFRDQRFGFSPRWGWNLAEIGRREEEARALLGSALPSSTPGLETIVAELRQSDARERQPEPVGSAVPLPDRRYRCIVIDPPWPMEKIERRVHPNQGVALDYPVMPLGEIAALPIADLSESPGAHIYLWTTHRFLPAALDLFEAWGASYQCLMTWVKNVGFSPFSWMYDTEHVIFGRIGSLPLNRMGLRLSFNAPVTRHSEKPDVFYERVLEASPGPRLDMFARRPREGFDVWGNEACWVIVDLAEFGIVPGELRRNADESSNFRAFNIEALPEAAVRARQTVTDYALAGLPF